MKNKKISDDNMFAVMDIIQEIIINNDDLRNYIEKLGSKKWNDFAMSSGAHKYEEQFDDADFQEHFYYNREQAEIEAQCEFIDNVSEKVVIMIEAYLKTFISN